MKNLKLLFFITALLAINTIEAQLISNTTFTTPSSGWYRVGEYNGSERGSVRVVVALRGGAHTPQSVVIDAFKTWSTGLHMDVKGINNHYLEQVRITYDGSKYHIEVYVDRAIVNNAHIHLYALEGSATGFSINSGVLASGGDTVKVESGDIIFKTQYENHLDLKKGLTVDGKVGIGYDSPAAQLVVGSAFGASISGSGGGNAVFGTNIAVQNGGANHNLLYTPHSHSGNYGYAGVHAKWGKLYFYSKAENTTAGSLVSPSTRMLIDGNGSVGIGTNSPSEKLEVNGTIRSKEVKVEASPWPDYVFEPNYNLRPLEEIEEFIESNNHLPDVPLATEVEENGIALGEMNALLLRKIEELTLYTIDQEKEIEKLKQANSKEPIAKSQTQTEANGVQLGEMNRLLLKKIEELTLYVIELKNENSSQQEINKELITRLNTIENELDK